MAVSFGTGSVTVLPDLKGFLSPLLSQVKASMSTASKQATASFGSGLKGLAGSITPVAAGMAGLGIAAVAGLTQAVHATVNAAEEVRKLSRELGVTAEEASRLRVAGAELGVGVDKLSVGFGIFSKHLVDGGASFEKYGIQIKDASGNQKSFETLLGEVADKFVALGPGIKGTALVMDVFGRSGKTLIPILAQGSAGIEKLMGRADELGQVMSEKDIEAAHQLEIAHRDLSLAFQGMEIQIGKGLLPVMENLAQVATDIAPIMGMLGKAIDFTLRGWGSWLNPLGQALHLLDLAPKAATATGRGIESLAGSTSSATREGKAWNQALVAEFLNTGKAADGTKKLTAAQLRNAAAAHASWLAQQQLTGGFLGLASTVLQIKADEKNLADLREHGKKGTAEYTQALLGLAQEQLGLNQGFKEYAKNLHDAGKSQDFVDAKVRNLAHQLGLQGGAFNKLIALVDRYIRGLYNIPGDVTTHVSVAGPGGSGVPINHPLPVQHGFDGIVRRATTFLAGEAGPEHVRVTPLGSGASGGSRISRMETVAVVDWKSNIWRLQHSIDLDDFGRGN